MATCLSEYFLRVASISDAINKRHWGGGGAGNLQ
jgi:hypothetical protein